MAAVRADLGRAYAEGFRAVAIVFMHAYSFPAHEKEIAAVTEFWKKQGDAEYVQGFLESPKDDKGRDLDMGTGFDAFTPLSHHGSVAIPVAAQRNRFLLLGLMSAAGWDFYGNEWWHYQLFDARRYPLLSDVDAPERMMPVS